MFQRLLAPLLALLVPMTILTPAQAQAPAAWPDKTVRLVVPFPPGGATDVLARLLAEEFRQTFGQTFIVENKAGASGNIGGDFVARAPADGYTFLVAAAGPTVINPSLYPKMTFDPAKDLAPVTQVVIDHNMMAINPSIPATNVREFITWAKANPDKAICGTPGNGTPAHVGCILFNQLTGTALTTVSYKGSGPAVADLMGGQTAVMIDNMAAMMPQVRAGKLRALAVSGDVRATGAPDLPTIIESGVPGFSISAWKALMAPAGTPKAIIDKLQQATARALQKPELRQRLIDGGSEPVANTPDAFGELIRRETASWKDMIQRTGVRLE